MTTTPAKGRGETPPAARTAAGRATARAATPGAWIAFLLALALMVGLGVWQLYRLDWKTELIATRESQLALPPVEITGAPGTLDPATLGFRRARARGVFLHDRELYLAATRGGKVGFDVITPLRLADGGTILVDRGWVPAERRDPARRAEGQVAGPVTVEGVLRPAGRKRWLTPDNDRARNYWFWRDIPAMAEAAGVEAAPVLLVAGPAPNPGGWPKGRAPRVDLPNNHLGYAATWFLLAGGLVVIFVVWKRQKNAAARGGDGDSGGRGDATAAP